MTILTIFHLPSFLSCTAKFSDANIEVGGNEWIDEFLLKADWLEKQVVIAVLDEGFLNTNDIYWKISVDN